MTRDRDLLDIVLGWLIHPIAARYFRRKTTGPINDQTRAEWQAVNPGRCMYCSYTRWANTEHHQKLKVEPHDCIEGNSPAMPLPIARIR